MEVEVKIDTSKAFATLEDLTGFFDKIADAINQTHQVALEYEKLGLTAGKYYREAMELLGTNLEKSLAEYGPESKG